MITHYTNSPFKTYTTFQVKKKLKHFYAYALPNFLKQIETFFIRETNVPPYFNCSKKKKNKFHKNLFISKINNRRVTPLPLFQIIYIENYWTTKCKYTREGGSGALFKNSIGHRLIFVIAFSSLTIDRS